MEKRKKDSSSVRKDNSEDVIRAVSNKSNLERFIDSETEFKSNRTKSKLEDLIDSEIYSNNENKKRKSGGNLKTFLKGALIGVVVSSPLLLYPLISAQKNNNIPKYDQQEAVVFSGQKFKSLEVDVSATEQKNKSIDAATYILNGLANNNAWYQVGLANTPNNKDKFQLAIDIFSGKSFDTNSSLDRINLGLDFSKPVKENDTVRLSLIAEGNKVIFSGRDLNTGGTASYTYFSSNPNVEFLGTEKSGIFTGIMTEIYHRGSKPVIESDPIAYKYVGSTLKTNFEEIGFFDCYTKVNLEFNADIKKMELVPKKCIDFKPVLTDTGYSFKSTLETISFKPEEAIMR